MEDIVPELYKKIKKMFDGLVSSDEEIQAILNGEKDGTFAELYPMSKRVGQYAAKSLSNHYTEELLPDGILYWNIMERTFMPIMKNVHKIDNQLAFNVQKKLDAAQKIGIKPQESDFPEDRVNSVMNMLSTLTQNNKTDLQRASQVLTRSIVNVSNSIIDNFIQKNAEFRANAGMTAKIIRTSSGHCCEWCNEIAGTYKYPDVPKDVYRRHDNCDCRVDYVVGKTRQDVWTKKKNMHGALNGAWNDENDRNYKIRERIAKDLYIQIINRKKEYEINAVSKNSGYSYNEVEKIYNHIFIDEHLFVDGSIHKFEPDYYMAHSWIRLRSGKNIQEHDLILLGHELEERKIIDSGVEIEYEKAHNIANRKYNYEKALFEYLREHDV